MNTTMAVRSILLSALVAATSPVFAQVTFNVTVGPPPALVEVAPVMAPGYVWAPGYWAWHGDRHIWVRGRAIVQRAGYRWEPDVWEQRNNTYYRHPGRWERDANYRMVEMQRDKPPKQWKNNGKGHDKKAKPGKGKKNDD